MLEPRIYQIQLPAGHLKHVLTVFGKDFLWKGSPLETSVVSIDVKHSPCPTIIMELNRSCLTCQNQFHALMGFVKWFLCLWILILYSMFDW